MFEIGRIQPDTPRHPQFLLLHDAIEKNRTIIKRRHQTKEQTPWPNQTERSNAKDTQNKELDRSGTHATAFVHHDTVTRSRYGMPVGSATNI